MKDIITSIIEFIGAVLIIAGVYQFNESLGIISSGILLIAGSYFYSRRV